jgi:hypothetical protein
MVVVVGCYPVRLDHTDFIYHMKGISLKYSTTLSKIELKN